MTTPSPGNLQFQKGLMKLGFSEDDSALYFTANTSHLLDPLVSFHIERALELQASAIYFRRQLNGSFKAQVYLYDNTASGFDENELTSIQKAIWSSGEVPIACIFYKTEIKILDCTTHINNDNTPVYLLKSLQLTGAAHKLYNQAFAIKIKSGLFWDEEENRTKFKFQNSSYDKLIDNIKIIISELAKSCLGISDYSVNKIIVQSILIKYLEERIDGDGNKLLSDKFFKKYDKATTFTDVLKRKGKFVELIEDLNDPVRGFNGNIFEWTKSEKSQLAQIDLNILAELLDTSSDLRTGQRELWRYFEFKYIPVELISRLYEEFLGKDKKDKGLYYTPSHLAKLLVDEAIPLQKYQEINLSDFKILDPACGSGIFLVVAYKRLVQIWRLQNAMALPELPDLKKILRNIYGVDKEEQATRLASFSLCLALCNELKPIDIINKLKFDDLTKSNVFNSDFFQCKQLDEKKFDLIIGNPPFNRGAIKSYSGYWNYAGHQVKIPQGQIALKFLSEALSYLKDGGLQCLIIKSSGLLYNTSSKEYKALLFSKLNVVQVLDFTALARNKALWDNGADVASAAIFVRNELPDFNRNLLHLTFRRTKATKERIAFEIDDYDLHFMNRQSAINNEFIWKINLLGGGRIKSVVEKTCDLDRFETYLSDNELKAEEGFIVGTNGPYKPKYIFNIPTLPTEAISAKGIDYTKLEKLDRTLTFDTISADETIFTTPNILIWENIGGSKLPVFYNDQQSFSFRAKIIGIASKKPNPSLLKSIVRSFNQHSSFYKFYIYVTSSQLLINLNTAVLKTDFMQLPFIAKNSDIKFSEIDQNIIADVNDFMQDFVRHGENSRALKPVMASEFKRVITHYGEEFSRALNLIFKNQQKKYRLSEVVNINSSFIAVVFRYDNKIANPSFHDKADVDLVGLTTHDISQQLSINRIIKIYPGEDTVIFVKPNQIRYWLSLIAYRDADKCFSDLAQLRAK